MTKLSKVKSKKPLPTDVEGVFVRNIPAKKAQDLFGDMDARIGTEAEAVIVELFNNLVCDDKGNTFDDVETFGAIMEVLSMVDIQEIMLAVAFAINPSAKDLKK